MVDALRPRTRSAKRGPDDVQDEPDEDDTSKDRPDEDDTSKDKPDEDATSKDRPDEDERWLIVKGRRWRRTDPCLPTAMVEALKSHLGRGRSGVRVAQRRGDQEAVAAARARVDLAKHGLGERGPRWWDDPEADRVARAKAALAELASMDQNGDQKPRAADDGS